MKLRANIVSNYVGRAYAMASTYLFIPFYVAILGPAAYGVIAFYTLLLTIGALADVGLSSTFAREAARQSDKRELIHLLVAAERILLAGALLFSLATLLGASWIVEHWLNIGPLDSSDATISLRLMALMIAPHLLFSLYSAGMLGLQRQVYANMLQVLFITARSGLVILVISWKPDLPTFFLWQLGATLAFMAVARIVLVRSLRLPWFAQTRFKWRSIQGQLGYAMGMLAITLIAGVNTQLDKLLISRSLSLTELGFYSLASVVAQLPSSIATPIAVALFPKLVAHIAAGEIEEAYADYGRYGRLIAFVGGLSGFGLILFAPEILEVWLQRPSLPSVVPQVASLLAVGGIFLCLQLLPYYLSLAYGENRTVALVAGATLLVSVPLTFLAIHTHGLLGAAGVWVLVTGTNYLTITIAVHRRRFPGQHLAWVMRSVVAPLMLAGAPLLLARLLANQWADTPFASIVWAVAGALSAAGIFGFQHFSSLRHARKALDSKPAA